MLCGLGVDSVWMNIDRAAPCGAANGLVPDVKPAEAAERSNGVWNAWLCKWRRLEVLSARAPAALGAEGTAAEADATERRSSERMATELLIVLVIDVRVNSANE